MVGRCALDAKIGVRVPASEPVNYKNRLKKPAFIILFTFFMLWVWKESNLRPLSYQDSVLPLNYTPS